MVGVFCSESLEHLQSWLDTGRFAKALRELQSVGRPVERAAAIEWDTLFAELSLETGNSNLAVAAAHRVLANQNASAYLSARAHRVLSNTSFYSGSIDSSQVHLAQARNLCSAKDTALLPLLAHVELLGFSLASRFQPIDTALSLLSNVRRLITRAGHPHLLVLLRIAVARAEIRRRSSAEAHRHHVAAFDLISAHPNVWLEGLIEIDASAGSMVTGDLTGCLDHARNALKLSEESGHSRTRLAASINIAQALEMGGDTERAHGYLDDVIRDADGNQHLLRAALDSLANLWITKGDYAAARDAFIASDDLFKGESSPTLNWDVITELNSRARLEQFLWQWSEAHSILSNALSIAQESEDAVWIFRLSLAKARCLAMMGRPADAVLALPARSADELIDPE